MTQAPDSIPPQPAPRLATKAQDTAYQSPWTFKTRIALLLWLLAWFTLCRFTPKYFYHWRTLVLKIFGAKIEGTVFVASSAVIKFPWNLTMRNRACLGPNTEVYNLAPVTLGERCTIAQQVYLCAGTHDFTTPSLPLVVGPITIQPDVFIGARAFVMPGVIVGQGAVVGACAVVTRDLPPWMICAGNPAKPLKPRQFEGRPND